MISRVCSTSRWAAAASARRGVELAFALARLGDVAGHADHAARASIGVAHRDAVLARPAPRAVAPAIAEFDVEARDFALVEGGDHPRVMRPVVGMDDVGEFAHRAVFRQVEHLDQRRGEIDHAGVEIDVVGAGADADRLQRERVARFQIALVERGHGELLARRCLRGLQRELALLDLGDVARRPDETLSRARRDRETRCRAGAPSATCRPRCDSARRTGSAAFRP